MPSEYTARAFMWDAPEVDPIFELGLSQQQILGISYLWSIRRKVVVQDFSFLANFDGRHRSGKSTCASVLGYIIDPTFWDDFENRVVYTPKDLMAAIERLEQSKIRGGVIIVDEAGVSLANDAYYEVWLKTISRIFQVFGYLNPIVFFCLPVSDDLAKKFRKLLHAYYAVNRPSNEYTMMTPYNLKYSVIMKKQFFRKPKIRIGSARITLRDIRIGKPPEFILKRYQNLAALKKPEAMKELQEDFRKTEIKENKETADITKLIDHVIANTSLYTAKRSKADNIILDVNRIEFGLKVSRRNAAYIKAEAERKVNASIAKKLDAIAPEKSNVEKEEEN